MKPRIMGVLNCTHDSFYDGGRFDDLIDRGRQLINLQTSSMLVVNPLTKRKSGSRGRA